MTRYAKTSNDDVLALLRFAVRRRTNPFAVMEGLVEALTRKLTPPEVGEAVLTFDSNLAAEARDAVERVQTPIARFFEATVPANVDGLRVETAWRGAAHALTKLARFERKPSKQALERLSKLAADDVVLEGAQVALAASSPVDVEANRWFFPLLLIDGGPASVDALLPHLDAALTSNVKAAGAFKPLVTLVRPGPLAEALKPLQ